MECCMRQTNSQFIIYYTLRRHYIVFYITLPRHNTNRSGWYEYNTFSLALAKGVWLISIWLHILSFVGFYSLYAWTYLHVCILKNVIACFIYTNTSFGIRFSFMPNITGISLLCDHECVLEQCWNHVTYNFSKLVINYYSSIFLRLP